jgi:hypothetical protein
METLSGLPVGPGPGVLDPGASPSSPPPRAATNAALFSFFNSFADFPFAPPPPSSLGSLPFALGLADCGGLVGFDLGWEDSPLLLALVAVVWGILGDAPAVLGPDVVDGVVEVMVNVKYEIKEELSR